MLAAGTQSLAVTFTPTDAADYTSAPANVSLTVNKAAATVTFDAGTLSQTYSAAQKTVATTTTPPGLTVNLSFTGAPVNASSYPVTATVSDPNYTGSASGILVIGKASPIINWASPAAITFGTAINATQLDASANVSGTFVYNPTAGTVLGAGTQNLNATFTPADATDYTTVPADVSLTVNKALPTITWLPPAAITYGTALSSTQLDASANVPGNFVYAPPLGTVLAAGTQNLAATFTPTDAADYSTAPASVSLTVNKAAATITWAQPAAVTYGTALSSAQLDASANVPGTFAYVPTAGTVLGAGTQNLTATFTPTNTADYTTIPANVLLTVNKALPTITLGITRRHHLRHRTEQYATRCFRQRPWNLYVCANHRDRARRRHPESHRHLHPHRRCRLHQRASQHIADREPGYRSGHLRYGNAQPNV